MDRKDLIQVKRYNTGELLGYGIEKNNLRIGKWKYFYKNGNLWQLGSYDKEGRRIASTWNYFEEEAKNLVY